MSDSPRTPRPPGKTKAPPHESLRAEFKDSIPTATAYGEARLWVVARDPHCLFCYWEFRPSEHPEAAGKDGIARFFLRIARGDGSEESTTEIRPEAGIDFVTVARADSLYSVELGFFANGVWCFMTRSSIVRTPPDSASDDGPEHFATIPAQVPLQGLHDLMASSAVPGEGVAQTAARVQATADAQGPWTEEQQRLLEQILAADMRESLDFPGSSSSLIQRIRHRLSAAKEAAGPVGPLPAPEEGFLPGSPGSEWPTSPGGGR